MTLNWWNVAILGVVQGITELLPISSDGHLALTQILLNLQDIPLTFDITLHAGTLLAILWYFRQDWMTLDWNKWRKVALATVPVAILGVAARASLDSVKYSTLAIGLGFWFTAILLYISQALFEFEDRQKARHPWRALLSDFAEFLPRSIQKVFRVQPNWVQVLYIGVMQALAILPGVSRSGSALAGGLLVGLSKEKAFHFGFLIGIPAIAGAVGYDLFSVWTAGEWTNHPWGLYAWGAVVAAVTGVAALQLLEYVIRRSRFEAFIAYLIFVGFVTVFFV